ncbi:MAG: glycerol dehydrogenase [Spirochaetales bacterium]|jgi:glycerol dehydrogenase|nr:glycerol dehydrogenase [Spirochaetales bacterium]
MTNIIASPSRYIQGNGVLGELRLYAEKLGKKFFILVSSSGKKRVQDIIQSGIAGSDIAVHFEIFTGECSRKEIERVRKAFSGSGSDLIIGIGGGKIHDTAKAAAFYEQAPLIIVPTIASTDAPCSALSVIYSEAGVFEEYLFFPSSPNMVIVDTGIVAAAPSRLLVAGMGDALATYFEARACVASQATNCVGGKAGLAAYKLAQLCYETLLRDGYNARIAAENGICTKVVENIIEANTYLSGIGFESAGLAAAHAVHNGMTAIEETHAFYHGEKVAFGTLVQLVLENASNDLDDAFTFCEAVGLPITLADLGVKNPDPAKLKKAAALACAGGDTMGNMPFTVTPDMAYNAILAADALGRARAGTVS